MYSWFMLDRYMNERLKRKFLTLKLFEVRWKKKRNQEHFYHTKVPIPYTNNRVPLMSVQFVTHVHPMLSMLTSVGRYFLIKPFLL